MSEYTLSVRLTGESGELVGELRTSKDELDRLSKSADQAGKQSAASAKDLDKLTDSTKSGTSEARKMSGELFSLQGVMAGLTVAGIGAMIKGTLDAADEIQKLGLRIGASSEALSEYRHVAELTGVQFDSLTTAWQRQSRRISEAAQGTGEAKDALEELGLSAQYLEGLRPEEQFELLADAMTGVASQGDKVRLAMRLWDTEGVQLLQTIQGGSQAIGEMRDEAEELGLSLSQDQVDAAAAANDAIYKLTQAFKGASDQLALEFAPALADAATFLGSTLPEVLAIPKAALADLGDTIGGVAAALVALFSGEFTQAAAIWDDVRERFGTGFLEEGQEAWDALSGAVADYGDSARTATSETQPLEITITNAGAAAVRSKEQTKELNKELDAFLGLLKEATEGEAADYFDWVERIDRLTAEKLITDQQAADALAFLHAEYAAGTEEIEQHAESTKKAKAEAEQVPQVYKDVASSIHDSFTDMFRGIFDDGIDSFEDLGDDLLDIFKDILAEMATLAIAEPIIVPLISGVGDVLGVSSSAQSSVLGELGLSDAASLGSSFLSLEGTTATLSAGFEMLTLGGAEAAAGLGMIAGAALPVVGALGAVAALTGLFSSEPPPTEFEVATGTAGTVYPDEIRGAETTSSLGATSLHLIQTGDEGQISEEEAAEIAAELQLVLDAMTLLDEALVTTLDLSGETVANIGAAIDDLDRVYQSVEAEDFDIERFGNLRFDAIFDEIGGVTDAVYDQFRALGDSWDQAAAAVLVFEDSTDELRTFYEDALENLSGVAALAGEGESVSSAFVRLGLQLIDVNATLDQLGLSTLDLTLAGAGAADNLLTLAGGIESLQAASDYYFDNFYSAEEQRARLLADAEQQVASFNAEFGEFGAVAYDNEQSLRAYIEGLDLTEEAQQEAYVAALNLAPTLVDVADAMAEANAEAEALAAELADLVSGIGSEVSAIVYRNDPDAEIADLEAKWGELISGINSWLSDVEAPESLQITNGLSIEQIDALMGEIGSYVTENFGDDQGVLDAALAILADWNADFARYLELLEEDAVETDTVVVTGGTDSGGGTTTEDLGEDWAALLEEMTDDLVAIFAPERTTDLILTSWDATSAQLNQLLGSLGSDLTLALDPNNLAASTQGFIAVVDELVAGLGDDDAKMEQLAALVEQWGTDMELLQAAAEDAQAAAEEQANAFEELKAVQDGYIASLNDTGSTLWQQMQAQRDSVFELVAAFDGTTESIVGLTGAADDFYASVQAVRDLISDLRSDVATTTADSIEQVLLAGLDEEGRYDYLTDQAEAIANSIESMIDPEAIGAAFQDATQYALEAFNVLDNEQQADVSAEFATFFEELEAITSAALDAADAALEEDAGAVYDTVDAAASAADTIARAVSEALNLAANAASQSITSAGNAAASGVSQAAGTLAAAAATPHRVDVRIRRERAPEVGV